MALFFPAALNNGIVPLPLDLFREEKFIRNQNSLMVSAGLV